MSKVQIKTKSGYLTDEDFDGEAPSPGSSDNKYSAKAKRGFQAIADRVAAQIKKSAPKYNDEGNREVIVKSADGEEFVVEAEHIPDA